MAPVRAHPCLPAGVVQAVAVVLLLGWVSGCSITGEPSRARIESALPSLRDQVAQMSVHGSETELTSGLSADDALRVAMASCVRYYCLPEGLPGVERRSLIDAELADRVPRRVALEFQSPQNVPTALPLSGWFGPLRGHEEMMQVRQLHIVLRQGQWAEVIARHEDDTWSCWRSNWRTESS
jgi:hypothetical protein